jgi:hypothetical protein
MFRCALLAVAGVLALAASAQATNYGSLNGPRINYLNISENDSQIIGPPTVTGTPIGLFGAPTLSPPGSDTMTFPNLTFSVGVANGTFELQDGKLSFDMTSNPSTFIHSMSFDEGGAWRVLGPAGAAISEATLLFNDLRITSVNGIPLGSAIIVNPAFSVSNVIQNGAALVTPGTGDITFTSSGGNGVGTWDILANFNLDNALDTHGFNHNVDRITGMSVALDNQLFAQTQTTAGLTLATIDKKHFIVSTVSTIPEPSTMILGALGAAGLVVARLKAKKSAKV